MGNVRVYFVDDQGALRFRQDPLTQSESDCVQIIARLLGGKN